MEHYDCLIVGAGLYGATVAQRLREAGRTCLVVDKRAHIGGNAYTERIEGIETHRYGAHIFHTSNARVWRYVNRFARFNHFVNCPLADYHGKLYNLPFNMHTFYQLWGVTTPGQARAKLSEQTAPYRGMIPKNLEEQALLSVGRDLYETLIKGYTEKQWGRGCAALPPDILKRVPLRFTYDNNYFDDPWQGVPEDGYTAMIARMLEGARVIPDTDYIENRKALERMCGRVLYTGGLDALYGFRLGALAYRSLRFETKTLDIPDAQGVAVINHTDAETPYTRVIEHKHFTFGAQTKTVLTYEYSEEWSQGKEPYYPIGDAQNRALYEQYATLARADNILVGGRLGSYRYLNMDQVISEALTMADGLLR